MDEILIAFGTGLFVMLLISVMRTGTGRFENRRYLIFRACNNAHFILLISNVPKWELLILDSKNFVDFQREAAYFVIEATKNFLYLRASHLLKPRKPVTCYVPRQNIPRQVGGDDCGMFLMMYLDAFTQGHNLEGIN